MYANLGYAVVATDYTGLGCRLSECVCGRAVERMERDRFGSGGARRSAGACVRWIAMGVGEGAAAVLQCRELERGDGRTNFLGSIAISQIADLEDQFGPTLGPSSDLPLLLAHGIKAIDQAFKPEQFFSSAQAMPLYEKEQEECGVPEASQFPAAALFKPGWQSNKFVREYFDRNRLGTARTDAPLLVVSGEEGASMVATVKVIRRLCGQGDRVLFHRYAEGNPDSVIGDSTRDQMAWIQDRFANCP